MSVYNIYYFVIKPLRINASSGSTGTVMESPGMDSPVAQSIFAGFQTRLIELMDQSKEHIPRHASRNQTINVIRIPPQQDNPVSPDFSGVEINIHEPIVYFTTRANESSPDDQADRRPEYGMFEALRNVHCQEFPDSWINDQLAVLRNAGELSGLSVWGIPGISFPVTACVFSDGRQNFGASNWQSLMSNKLASAAFHEIAHCKAQTDNRSHNPRWRPALSGSIHEVTDVHILAQNGVGGDPSTADFVTMGEHMLCPINFYRLDQSIDTQCFSEGEIVTLTPRT